MSSSRIYENFGEKPAYVDPESIPLQMNASNSDIRNMQDQARRGSWRPLLESIKELHKLPAQVFTPEERLVHTTYHIWAMAKLGNYAGAAEELDALGDLQSKSYSYESYPELYPGKTGSMIPFGLRWLQAAIPYRLGQPAASMERMYSLLNHCIQKEKQSSQVPGEEIETGELLSSLPLDEGVEASQSSAGRWRRRRDVITFGIINLHLGQKDYVVALRFMDGLLARNPGSPELWSKFAHIQLQLGDVKGAKLTFAKVEELVEKARVNTSDDSTGSGESLGWLVGRNKGVQAFVDKQYAAAVKAFNSVLEVNPEDAIAANNKALCLMYSRDLIRGSQVLEDVLHRHTVASLNETLVLNLCSMYELAAVNSTESKRKLSSWILQVAPDDFDLNCTRL